MRETVKDGARVAKKVSISVVDETGKYKSHEPEPVTITVKELGIKDWIKG